MRLGLRPGIGSKLRLRRAADSKELRIITMHVDEGEKIARWYVRHAHHEQSPDVLRRIRGPVREGKRWAKCMLCSEAIEVVDREPICQNQSKTLERQLRMKSQPAA
jgi:hypothetical protein